MESNFWHEVNKVVQTLQTALVWQDLSKMETAAERLEDLIRAYRRTSEYDGPPTA